MTYGRLPPVPPVSPPSTGSGAKSWEEAIDAYIRDFSLSYSDILEIENEDEMLHMLMAKYAPVSIESADGAWAKGVKQFLQDIREQS